MVTGIKKNNKVLSSITKHKPANSPCPISNLVSDQGKLSFSLREPGSVRARIVQEMRALLPALVTPAESTLIYSLRTQITFSRDFRWALSRSRRIVYDYYFIFFYQKIHTLSLPSIDSPELKRTALAQSAQSLPGRAGAQRPSPLLPCYELEVGWRERLLHF